MSMWMPIITNRYNDFDRDIFISKITDRKSCKCQSVDDDYDDGVDSDSYGYDVLTLVIFENVMQYCLFLLSLMMECIHHIPHLNRLNGNLSIF